MSTFETFIVILTSGVFLGILGLFYRIGRAHEFMESKFKSMDDRFTKIDDRFIKFDDRFDKIDQRFNSIDRDLGRLTTRVAVMESKLTDISNNVSHLMWHNQSLPQKDVQEQ